MFENTKRGLCPVLLVAAVALPAVVRAQDDLLTVEQARRVMEAASAYAGQHGAPGGAIAIVDAGGALILFERLPGTFPAASRIAIGKASTAAAFRRPTKVFEDAINGGRHSMTALPDFFPLQGGVPLMRDGAVVGAVGVSGAASADQDTEIAEAGAAAMRVAVSASETRSPVRFVEGAAVNGAFAAGAPLFEDDELKIHASRRDGPGEAEVHLEDTDVFYVLSGRATFVTGGTLVNDRRTVPGEIRASTIAGGEERELSGGDVIVIPRGTPHWFRDVSAPFVYYVVKVSSPRERRS